MPCSKTRETRPPIKKGKGSQIMSPAKHAPKKKRSGKALTVLSVAGISLAATASGSVAEMTPLGKTPAGPLGEEDVSGVTLATFQLLGQERASGQPLLLFTRGGCGCGHGGGGGCGGHGGCGCGGHGGCGCGGHGGCARAGIIGGCAHGCAHGCRHGCRGCRGCIGGCGCGGCGWGGCDDWGIWGGCCLSWGGCQPWC
jgi:hypothetical protein